MQEVAATENPLLANDNSRSVRICSRRHRERVEASRHLRGVRPMARKNAPSNQGAIWTTKDFAAIRRLVKRSEEHTSELQSRENLVCRLLLEKKKKKNI